MEAPAGPGLRDPGAHPSCPRCPGYRVVAARATGRSTLVRSSTSAFARELRGRSPHRRRPRLPAASRTPRFRPPASLEAPRRGGGLRGLTWGCWASADGGDRERLWPQRRPKASRAGGSRRPKAATTEPPGARAGRPSREASASGSAHGPARGSSPASGSCSAENPLPPPSLRLLCLRRSPSSQVFTEKEK